MEAAEGIRADLISGLKFLPDSSTVGITAMNPFIPNRKGMFSNDVLSEAYRVLEPGGELIVAATKGNSYARPHQSPSVSELDAMGFEVVHHKVPLPAVQGYAEKFGKIDFAVSNGESRIEAPHMITIVLRKKP